ncbi:MAG: hypothetical protein WHV44_11640 [Anaerolineales bacterium]
MSRKTAYRLVTTAVLLISLGILGWTDWPPAAEQSRIFLRPNAASLPAAPNPPPGVLEPRVLSLLWPRAMRLGDFGRIRLEVAPDPSAPLPGPADASAMHLMLDARLEMPYARTVPPPGLVSQTMLPGQTVVFEWQVSPYEAGDVEGAVWVYYRFVVPESGEQEQVLMAVQPVRVRAVTLLGLSAGVARIIGWGGVVLGVILSLPLADEFLRRLLSKASA